MFFWASFWILNGLDKFINGYMVAPIEGYNRNGVITEPGSDQILYNLYRTHPTGWFGVTRDPFMIAFFARLGLPSWLAFTVLYTFGVIEILVGLLFLFILIYKFILPSDLVERIRNHPFMTTYSLHKLGLKLSIFIFTAFTVGDTLFGDRTELWEHSFYIVLILMTYNYIPDVKLDTEELNSS